MKKILAPKCTLGIHTDKALQRQTFSVCRHNVFCIKNAKTEQSPVSNREEKPFAIDTQSTQRHDDGEDLAGRLVSRRSVNYLSNSAYYCEILKNKRTF